MGYWDFKDSCKRTAADKLLRDRSVNIAKNPRYDGYQKDLASKVFLIKSRWVVQLKIKSGEIKNQLKNYTNQFLNFEKKKIEKPKLCSPFIDST